MNRRRPIALGLALALIGCTAGAQVQSPTPKFIPGQMLVKFRAGSPGAEAVDAVVAGSPKAEKKLGAFVRKLGARISRPLVAERVTSDKEVIVTLDPPALAELVIAELDRRAQIDRPTQLPPYSVGSLANLVHRINFADERAARAAQQAARLGNTTAPLLDSLILEAADSLALSISYHVNLDASVFLEIDVLRAIDDVLERLRALGDVEYAELDAPMQHPRRSL